MTLAIKHMDILTQNEARDLLEIEADPCISIYMPAVRKGLETQQNPIRLKNLLREAEKQLAERGMRDKQIESLLKPGHALQRADSFWEHQCDGLALFLWAEGSFRYRTPVEFDELLVINNQFHIKPLVPMLSGDGNFYLLSLSQGQVRLLQGTRYTIAEVDLQDAPRSLAEALRFDDFEKSTQHHSISAPGRAPQQGGSQGVFHGHGLGGDESRQKEMLAEFLQMLDRGVCDLLAGENSPLVLAGVEFVRGYYKKTNHYEHLLEDGIEGNPEAMSNEELHREALKILEPWFQRDRRDATDRIMSLANGSDSRGSFDLSTIANAAYLLQVDTLFIASDAQAWGRYDPENYRVDVHDEKQADDEDLLNFCVEHTLRGSGRIYQLESDEMPNKAQVAAIVRPGGVETIEGASAAAGS